ncbi:hypothetical protein [Aeromonas salmonicida]|uniref:hypothetical protein n=1 Tax=Aeromonas salmonicida TaxID=645 RepID=UPI0012D91427|nr:hypothetical protein [Aeromonas salmonicida]MUG31058.1 hypothetical protein [Aeromonas salmonicida]
MLAGLTREPSYDWAGDHQAQKYAQYHVAAKNDQAACNMASTYISLFHSAKIFLIKINCGDYRMFEKSVRGYISQHGAVDLEWTFKYASGGL